MLTLKNTNILVMVFDLIQDQVFHFQVGGFGQNVLIFGADMNSCIHIDNKKMTYFFTKEDQRKN